MFTRTTLRTAIVICAVAFTTIASSAQTGRVLQFLGRHTQRPASFDQGGAEVVTYDPATKTAIFSALYGNKITFLNMTNPAMPVFVREVLLQAYGGVVNSVTTRNGLVAVALEDAMAKTNPGKVVIFDMTGTFRAMYTVGALPDMLTFTPDGQRLVVCNEGEANSNYTIDPEGSVSIIDLTPGVASGVVRTVGFTSLNGKQDSLRAMGIRIYGPNASVAQDFEPEYAAITPDGKTAYVTLQEANAIAIVDVVNATLTRVVALGYKDYSRGLPRTTQYPWRDRPVLGTTAAGQDIQLGGFSGLWFEGYGADTNTLRFLTHPDRGPNAEPLTLRGQPRRPFALPNFQAEVIRFELNRLTGAFTIVDRVKLTRTDGTTPITGRPNLQAAGQGIAYTDEYGVDLYGNDIPNDPFGGDLEGIVVDSLGTWWMVDEYRPAIYNFNANGQLIARHIPAGTAASVGAAVGTYGTETLPAVYATRRSNRGFEAVAIEGNILYAFIQSSLDNPDNASDATSKASTWCRILAFNVVTKQVVGEYLYPMFEKFGSADKIGDAVSLGGGRFNVVERDDATGLRARKYIFEINLKGATNLVTNPPTLPPGRTIESLSFSELSTYGIRPVHKKKSVYLPGAGYGDFDKVEGLARISKNMLAVINDNDFGVGGSTLSNPPDGRITINANNVPVLGLIAFDRPNGLDPSDRDNAAGNGPAININTWPVYGMYEPDAISVATLNGETYIVTANEGDAREYDNFVEEVRVGSGAVTLDPTAFAAWPTLKNNRELGRLNITNTMGDLDGDGDYDELYTLGGRSFTVWNADGNLIWDSGNEFEKITAAAFPANFNTGHTTNAMDDRSDNKGPEPEGITVGVINDSVYAFIGLERMGHTMMYNITNPVAPKYIDYINSRNFGVTPNLANVDNGTVGDLGPEVSVYVPNTDSPNNTDLLIAANEIGGTVSVYQIRIPRIVSIPAATIKSCIGDRLTLSVTATGPTLTYQWTKNGVDIPGATSATYAVDVVNGIQGTYACRVTAAGGMTITPRATSVTVSERTRLTKEPVLMTQLSVDESVTLKVEATSAAGETYQWYKAGTALANGVKYQGAQGPNLTIRFVQFADTSSAYYCVVTGGCSSVRSRNSAVLIPRIHITQQPADTVLCPGDAIVLTTSARPSGGDRGLGYRWMRNGEFLAEGGRFTGVNSPSLRITDIRNDDQAQYSCLVTGVPSNLPRSTDLARIDVTEQPIIVRQPAAAGGGDVIEICSGTSAYMNVLASGASLGYQWYRDGQLIPLATEPSFTTRQNGIYTCRVTGRCVTTVTTTRPVTVTTNFKPLLGLQPQFLSVITEGQSLTLRIAVKSGTQPIRFQWYKAGKPIPGANGITYTIDDARLEDAGLYQCGISNDCGSEYTQNADVRVNRKVTVGVDDEAVAGSGLAVRCEPNPFDASSTLRIAVPVDGMIHVRVFDVNGTQVADLGKTFQAAGAMTLMLEGNVLPAAGFYLVRVELANMVATVPVIHTK